MKTSHILPCYSPGTALKWALVALLPAIGGLKAEEIEWTGASNNEFSDYRNYSPNAGLNGNDILVNTSVGNLTLSGNRTPTSIRIAPGGNGFLLGSTNNSYLTITDHLTVEGNTTATFTIDLKIAPTADSALKFHVGSGGNLLLYGAIGLNSVNGTFTKTGEGRLFISTSTGNPAAGATLNFEEGIVDLRGGRSIGSQVNPVPITLGSASTVATLTSTPDGLGAARVFGNLKTAGANQSRIQPKGELYIRELDASEGAQFTFDLSTNDHFISGETLDVGGALSFTFSGGVVGETYRLFSYSEVNQFDASRFTITNPAYQGSQWSVEDGVIRVQLIPEPGIAALAAAGGLLLFSFRRFTVGKR